MNEDTSMVACAVCGKRMSAINNRHLSSHGMTADDYKSRFPGKPMHSHAALKKMSERAANANASRKGKPRSDADLKSIREGIARRPSRKGISTGPMAEGQKRKLSEVQKAAYAAGRVHPRLGVSLSDDTKRKISEKLTGRMIGPEPARKAIATKIERGYDLAFFRGRTHSPETRRKISIKSSAYFGETRADRREPMIARLKAANVTLLNDVTSKVFQLQCNTCNHIFSRTPQNFHPSKFDPKVCDQCYPISPVSIAEDELAAFVRAMLDPHEVIVRSNAELIAPLELDIYIPTRRIAIEYCGLYWHSQLAGKTSHYHQYKFRACEALGIRLITIFEDEWLRKQDIVKSMLSNLLVKNQTRLGARQCEVVYLDPHESNAFVGKYHIGGRGSANHHYGLKYNGEIVSVMTFKRGEKSRNSPFWEINRFVTKAGLNVSGAASRLFNAFIRAQSPNIVISYADLRWGLGFVYDEIGFSYYHDTVPNYWYFAPNSLDRTHRYALRKRPDEPKDVTEWDLRKAEGFNRIFDCGSAKWLWCNPRS